MGPSGTKVFILSIMNALSSVKYLYGMTKADLNGLHMYARQKRIPSWNRNVGWRKVKNNWPDCNKVTVIEKGGLMLVSFNTEMTFIAEEFSNKYQGVQKNKTNSVIMLLPLFINQTLLIVTKT